MSDQTDEEPRPLTVEEVAAKFGVTDQSVRNWITSGRLRATRHGRVWRVRREDLDKMTAQEHGEPRALGVHRDPWDPATLGVPFRRNSKRTDTRSVWDGEPQPVVLTKRGRHRQMKPETGG